MTRLILIASLALIAAAVYFFAPGVLDQAGIVLSDYREIFRLVLLAASLTCFYFVHISDADKSRLYYAATMPGTPGRVSIHSAQGGIGWGLGAGMFLAISAVLLDTWTAFITAALVSTGISTVANFFLQVRIHKGVGLPRIDPDELSAWDYRLLGRTFWIRKFWRGRRRKYQRQAGGLVILGGIIIEVFR